MARPLIPIGSYGEISTWSYGHGKFAAEAQFRTADGGYKQVRRIRKTRNAARNAVREACADLAEEVQGADISSNSKFSDVAELYFAELEIEVTVGARAENGLRQYRSYLDNWVLPALGKLRMRPEVTTMSVQKLVNKAYLQRGFEAAKSIRSVASGVCGYGVQHGALTVNPVKGVKLKRGTDDRKPVRGLTTEQRHDLDTKLRQLSVDKATDSQGRSLGKRVQIWVDIPDLCDAGLATGGRIGEVLALNGNDIEIDEETGKTQVRLGWHLIRVKGKGLVRKRLRKGDGAELLLWAPTWSTPMWRQRKLAAGGGPLFPSWRGGWLDPSNVINRIREAFDLCGYEWATSHVMRKTVGKVLDEAGHSTSNIAAQLGNSRQVVEDHYVERRATNDSQADALEALGK